MSKFVFFSKSADAKAGLGRGEALKAGDSFKELDQLTDWRKKLSNFFICKIKFDNNTFTSAEHAFHYAKYKSIGQDDIAKRFALESGDPISKKDPSEIKVLAGKNPKKSLYVMSKIEQDTWQEYRRSTVKKILTKKFTQCSEAKDVLLKTKDAELWHNLGRSSGLEHWDYLEEIRKAIKEGKEDVDGDEGDDDKEDPDEKDDEEIPDEEDPDEEIPDEEDTNEEDPDEEIPDEKDPDEEDPDEEDPDEEDDELDSRDESYSLTFGEQVESDYISEKLGKMAQNGFSFEELKKLKERFTSVLPKGWPKPELIDLTAGLKKDLKATFPDLQESEIEELIEANQAGILILRQGVDFLLGKDGAKKMLRQQGELKYDDKGNNKKGTKVHNKIARHTVVFGEKEKARKPKIIDVEKKGEKGKFYVSTIIGFDTEDIPILTTLRKKLTENLPLKGKATGGKDVVLLAEGNHYYDLSETKKDVGYIGYHGDGERKIVVCARLGRGKGKSQPLAYQWYNGTGRLIGKPIKVVINHGDIYIMSEKATGWDWLKNIRNEKSLHLEHAANQSVVDSPPNRLEDRRQRRGKGAKSKPFGVLDESCQKFIEENRDDLEKYSLKKDNNDWIRQANKCLCRDFRKSDQEDATAKRLNPLTRARNLDPKAKTGKYHKWKAFCDSIKGILGDEAVDEDEVVPDDVVSDEEIDDEIIEDNEEIIEDDEDLEKKKAQEAEEASLKQLMTLGLDVLNTVKNNETDHPKHTEYRRQVIRTLKSVKGGERRNELLREAIKRLEDLMDSDDDDEEEEIVETVFEDIVGEDEDQSSELAIWDGNWSVRDCKEHPNSLFIFGDNNLQQGKGGQAVIRDCANALGIPTQKTPYGGSEKYYSDADLGDNQKQIDVAIKKIKKEMTKYQKVYFPRGGLGTGLAQLGQRAPKTFQYLCAQLKKEFGFINSSSSTFS